MQSYFFDPNFLIHHAAVMKLKADDFEGNLETNIHTILEYEIRMKLFRIIDSNNVMK